jgi:TonB family protein
LLPATPTVSGGTEIKPVICKVISAVLVASMMVAGSVLAIDVKVVTSKELWALFDRKALPIYPYEARRGHITGSGIFRMYINPDGGVRNVAVMKSTGSKILDLAAAGGLYRWHAIPGRSREVDMPVRFTMSR